MGVVAIGLIIDSMRRIALAAVLGMLACSCGFVTFELPRPTPPPFCAPVGALGSVQLDYGVAVPATLSVSSTDAERSARATMAIPDSATTCSVLLARYDNLSVHVPTVWVVHIDGLAMPAIGGLRPGSGAQPSPPVIRRMLVIVATDAPTLLLSIGMGE